MLAVIVHSAGIQDHVAARAMRMRLFCRFDSITKVFADGGYTGKLIGWAKETFGYGPSTGSSNAPSLGSTAHVGSAKTTNSATLQSKP